MIAPKATLILGLLTTVHAVAWTVDLFADDACTPGQERFHFTDVGNGNGCVEVGNYGTFDGINFTAASPNCLMKLYYAENSCKDGNVEDGSLQTTGTDVCASSDFPWRFFAIKC